MDILILTLSVPIFLLIACLLLLRRKRHIDEADAVNFIAWKKEQDKKASTPSPRELGTSRQQNATTNRIVTDEQKRRNDVATARIKAQMPLWKAELGIPQGNGHSKVKK